MLTSYDKSLLMFTGIFIIIGKVFGLGFGFGFDAI